MRLRFCVTCILIIQGPWGLLTYLPVLGYTLGRWSITAVYINNGFISLRCEKTFLRSTGNFLKKWVNKLFLQGQGKGKSTLGISGKDLLPTPPKKKIFVKETKESRKCRAAFQETGVNRVCHHREIRAKTFMLLT